MEEGRRMKDYYIVSNKHYQSGERCWTFWKKNANGYTQNLGEAGLFDKSKSCNSAGHEEYPILGKNNENKFYTTETFMIHRKHIARIGKPMLAIKRGY